MVNRAPWARYRQDNYTLPTASYWVLPIDYSFIKTQARFQLLINRRIAIKCNSFESTEVHEDEIPSQTWKWPVFTVNIIPHLNLEMKQGWGKESGFWSELPCSWRWALLPRLAWVLLPAHFHRKPLLSLDHFVCVSDWVGERFIYTDIWWGLLTSVTHQPLACGEGEVQAPFFTQTQETAANYLKAKGLGSSQDHVPCGLYKKATSVVRNFSQLTVRKNIYDYWMLWLFFECQSTKIVLQGEEQGESFLTVSCCLYGQQTLFSKPPQPHVQPQTTA